MPIPASHYWRLDRSDLHSLWDQAQLAAILTTKSTFERRVSLRQYGHARHLYKFRSVPGKKTKRDRADRKQLEGMLLRNELFASTVNQFNDPFDAQAAYRVDERAMPLREQIAAYLRKKGASNEIARAFSSDEEMCHPDAIEAQMKSDYQEILKQLGVCSLAATARDPLLWAHYAFKHTGIALQYRPSMDTENLLAYKVEYERDYPLITDFFEPSRRSIFAPLTRKSPSWEYEKEWRIIRNGKPNSVFHVRPEALTGVVLGMRISDEDEKYVRGLVAKRDQQFGLVTDMFKAEAAPGEYKLRMRRLS